METSDDDLVKLVQLRRKCINARITEVREQLNHYDILIKPLQHEYRTLDEELDSLEHLLRVKGIKFDG